MGDFVNSRLTNVAAIVGTVLILALNIILLVQAAGVDIPGLASG
jgi:manganese transport protein